MLKIVKSSISSLHYSLASTSHMVSLKFKWAEMTEKQR